MQKEFTRPFMFENRGCYTETELDGCSFMQGKEIITLEAILKSEIPLKDKFWFVCKKLATKEQNKKIAVNVAEIVLPIYEQKFIGDNRVRDCIEAVKLFLDDSINIDELNLKKRAAVAAYADAADAYDANAADAAVVNAADANAVYANAAVVNAADAADAVVNAADAADAADAYAANAAVYAANAAVYAYAYAAVADAAVVNAVNAADADGNTYTEKLLTYLIDFCNE